jgi:hypothetical protein
MIPNFDGFAAGNANGASSGDYPGGFLLIEPDGTQIVMVGMWNGTAWQYLSQDGSYIQMVYDAKTLFYPNGTVVKFNLGETNNRWLPFMITDQNGNAIAISYKPYSPTTAPVFPLRTAIANIVDTEGRIFTFNYYGDANYPPGTNSHPQYALASITCADRFSGTRILVQLDYTQVTLNYSFTGQLDSSVPAENSQVWEINSISYPPTQTGYLFTSPQSPAVSSYNGYGIATAISVQNNMSVSVASPQSSNYGNTIASTIYNYQVANTLAQPPQFISQAEASSGEPGGTYQYSTKIQKSQATVTTVETYPDSTTVTTVSDTTTSFGDPGAGNVSSVTVVDGQSGLNLSTAGYTYAYDLGTGTTPSPPLETLQPQVFPQVQMVTASADGGPAATTTYTYGNFGQLLTVTEQGFPGDSPNGAVRKTTYTYNNNAAYQNIFPRPTLVQLDLVATVQVTDKTQSPAVVVAETDFGYDETPLSPSYPITPAIPGYNTSYSGLTSRGNLTSTDSARDYR